MRAVLFEHIKRAMAEDSSIFFLTADVGFNLVETMFQRFPERAMNVGVAEQNMVGIAAGLCNLGFKPVCYSYTNFLSERAFEQLRDDVCVHGYAPIFLGTTTGFDNAILGPTHHSLDDIAVLKALPNMRIYSPSTSESVGLAIEEALAMSGEASFIRFTKNELSEEREITSINRFLSENRGAPVLVISHGHMAQNCVKALEAAPGSFSLFAMDRIKPLDEAVLAHLLKEFQRIVVAEDNFKSGLYNSVCQFAVEKGIVPRCLLPLAVAERYDARIGDQHYLESQQGLAPAQIVDFLAKVTEL